MRKIQLRINFLRYNQSTDVSAASQNHAVEKTAILVPETTNTLDDAEDQEDPVEPTSE